MKHTSYRGKTIKYDDVLHAMERFDKELRASFPDKRWVTYAIKHNDKLYPPKQIMRLATGMDHVGSGGKPVNSPFEELGFTVVALDENDVPSNLVEDTETEIAFSLEYDL